MRVSGIVLLFLAVGHVLIMHVLGDGVDRVNFAFVALRWQSRSGGPGTGCCSPWRSSTGSTGFG